MQEFPYIRFYKLQSGYDLVHGYFIQYAFLKVVVGIIGIDSKEEVDRKCVRKVCAITGKCIECYLCCLFTMDTKMLTY